MMDTDFNTGSTPAAVSPRAPTRQRPFRFRNTRPRAPDLLPWADWPPENQAFLAGFRAWLLAGHYTPAVTATYTLAARLTLALLHKPASALDPTIDLAQVRAYLAAHYRPATCATYHRGLTKLAHYLRRQSPPAPPSICRKTYLDPLPDWLAEAVQAYLARCQRLWPPDQRPQASRDTLSHLTLFLRWLAVRRPLTDSRDLTASAWLDYVETRLLAGICSVTLDGELRHLQNFARFLAETDHPICPRLLSLKPVGGRQRLPRDVPVAHLRQLQAQIEAEATAPTPSVQALGVLDRAWFRLMIYSGLRTGEIRRLRLTDLDMTARRVRLEHTKGRQARLVCLNPPTLAALTAYLERRPPIGDDHLFLYRHRPLSAGYCGERLNTYGRRCGLHVTPHQLRHSFATLLLNAGAPLPTVQTLLGHKYIDTTLNYARLYDGTVAADYYRAMGQIEPQLKIGALSDPPPSPAHLLAMVDTLRGEALNEGQRETVQQLRAAIVALAGESGFTSTFPTAD